MLKEIRNETIRSEPISRREMLGILVFGVPTMATIFELFRRSHYQQSLLNNELKHVIDGFKTFIETSPFSETTYQFLSGMDHIRATGENLSDRVKYNLLFTSNFNNRPIEPGYQPPSYYESILTHFPEKESPEANQALLRLLEVGLVHSALFGKYSNDSAQSSRRYQVEQDFELENYVLPEKQLWWERHEKELIVEAIMCFTTLYEQLPNASSNTQTAFLGVPLIINQWVDQLNSLLTPDNLELVRQSAQQTNPFLSFSRDRLREIEANRFSSLT